VQGFINGSFVEFVYLVHHMIMYSSSVCTPMDLYMTLVQNPTNLTWNFFNSVVSVDWVGGSIVCGFWSALKQNLNECVYSNCGLTKKLMAGRCAIVEQRYEQAPAYWCN